MKLSLACWIFSRGKCGRPANCGLVHGSACDVENGIAHSRGIGRFRVRSGLSRENSVRVPQFPPGEGEIPFIFEVGGKVRQSSGFE